MICRTPRKSSTVIFLLTAIALALLFTCGGCRSQNEQSFLASDVQTTAKYVELSHPAATAYANELIAKGGGEAVFGQQLRANLDALAAEVNANGKTKISMLDTNEQFTQAAAQALKFSEDVLAEFLAKRAASTQPAK